MGSRELVWRNVVCGFWVLVVLVGIRKVAGNSQTGLSEILRNGVTSDKLLETLAAMENKDNRDSRTEGVTIKSKLIQNHIQKQTGSGQESQKASVGFMIGVFEHLLQGEDMPLASGHTDTRTRSKIRTADTIRSYNANKYIDDFIFHIPALPNHELVEMTEIRFLSDRVSRRQRRLTLRLQKEGGTFVKQKIYFSSAKTTQSLSTGSTSLINQLKGNMTIKVSFRKSDMNKMSDIEENLPILVIYSSDQGFLRAALKSINSQSNSDVTGDLNTSIRTKRAATNRKRNRKRKRDRWRVNSSEPEACKMHNFKVDFDLIGWGPWIIHPKSYNAKVCFGQCPSPISSEYTPTNHVMLQSLMRIKRPLSGPEPCCVPTKLRPLSMLYFEYDDIVVRHHQDMIVDECGCR